MTYNGRVYARLRNRVLFISLGAWSIILLMPPSSACCARSELRTPFEMLLAPASAAWLAVDWGLMLIAMMAPTIVPALYHIRISSFAARGGRLSAFFAAGYGAVWIVAGAVMLTLAFSAKWWAPESYVPAMLTAAGAVVWQASPGKQRCLNRCHSHRALAAFGLAADWDVFRLGVEHGLWCVASCWATMLFPMLLPAGHFLAMVAVSILMFCERLDPPKTPSWRWRGFGTAFRYLSLRLRGSRSRQASSPVAAQA